MQFPVSDGRQPGLLPYTIKDALLSTPFHLNSSSGELTVSRSLQEEGTLSAYDIVVVIDDGNNVAWTVTTIIIGEMWQLLVAAIASHSLAASSYMAIYSRTVSLQKAYLLWQMAG